MHSSNSPKPRVALVSCMRNEGLFVAEWLAYHLTLGFSDILVYTNACSDGSDLLLNRLDALGYVTHIPHTPPENLSPQLAAMEHAFKHPAIASADWMAHIDADEFFRISAGDGSIHALLEAVGSADVIALLWRLFGNAGISQWDGGSVLQSFTRTQPRPMRRVIHHKSIWRPEKFSRAIDHMPKDPKVADVRLVNSSGAVLDPKMLWHPIKCRYKVPFQKLTFENACINHYAVKSNDHLLMKNDRGDGHGNTHERYFLNSTYHRKYNRNEVEDRAILESWAATQEILAEMRADAQVAELEQACLDAFRNRRNAVLTPHQIEAWTAKPQPA